MVPKEQLRSVIEDSQLCHDYAKTCKTRVEQLGERGTLADSIIADQEKTLAYMESENKRLKIKDYFVNPYVGAALGIAAGMILQSQVK